MFFNSQKVGNRSLMFHVWFLDHVARLSHRHSQTKSPCSGCRKSSCLLALYERSKGIPASTLVDDLQKTV